MKFNKSIFISLFVITTVSNIHCKKKKLHQEDGPSKPEHPSDKVFLPVKFQSKSLTLTLSYLEKTTFLKSIENSVGTRAEITYKDKRILKVTFSERGKVTAFIDFIGNSNKINSIQSWLVDLKVNISTGNYTLSYDEQNRISEAHYYGVDRLLFKQMSFKYLQDGNISEINTEQLNETSNSGYRYGYDTRTGICKHISFFSYLYRELGYDFLYPTPNNPVSATGSGSEKDKQRLYNYTYNDQGYPSEISITKKNIKETFSITYQELLP